MTQEYDTASRRWRSMKVLAWAALAAGGCARAAAPAPEVPAQAAAPVTRPRPPPEVSVVLHLRADLDGDDLTELVLLDADGTLRIGDARRTTIGDGQPTLEVIDLDAATAGLELLLVREGQGEDPPAHAQVFALRGDVIARIFDVHSHDPPRFPGDGTARVIETDWSACPQGPEQDVRYVEVTYAPGPHGRFVEVARVPTGGHFGCDDWSG